MASWRCSPTSHESGRTAAIVARRSRNTSWLTSIAPCRPVMLPTSMRQPSNPSAPSIAVPRSQRAATPSAPRSASRSCRRAQVELRQGRHVEPSDVVVGVLGEEVVAGLRSRGVGPRRLEPAVVVAGVVGREVADHPDATAVGGVDERRERGVATEHRVDDIERRGVVAMARPRREHRREVDQVDAELFEVIEALTHPDEVAAVELAYCPLPVGGDRSVPVATRSPSPPRDPPSPARRCRGRSGRGRSRSTRCRRASPAAGRTSTARSRHDRRRRGATSPRR